MAMAAPLLNPCVLAKLKKPWEEGKFMLKADNKHLIRMLQTVKSQFEKQRARKSITVDEKMRE